MDIGFVSPWSLNSVGGVEFWFRGIVPRLYERDEVRIVTTNSTDHFGPVKRDLEGLGVEINEVKVTSYTEFPYQGLRSLANLFRASGVVYYVCEPRWLLPTSCILQELFDVPVVGGHHGPPWLTSPYLEDFDPTLPHQNPVTQARTPLTQRLTVRLLGPRSLRVARLLKAHHVFNRYDAQILSAWKMPKIHVIPGGVDTSRFHPNEKYDVFTILLVTKLERYKGILFLPAIVEALNKRIENFHLVVVGDGFYTGVVAKLRSERIRWLGMVTDDETKSELFSKSHVLLSPSTLETFMLTGVEALASGTPVVTFDIPGPREYIINGYNGYLVSTIDELVDKIIEVYIAWKKGGDYEALMRNARSSSMRFSWDVVTPKVREMLLDVARE